MFYFIIYIRPNIVIMTLHDREWEETTLYFIQVERADYSLLAAQYDIIIYIPPCLSADYLI